MLNSLLASTATVEPGWSWLALLLSVSLKGAILILCATGAVLALQRASAATRHLVWSLAFTGLLVLPLLSLSLPAWQIPLLPNTRVVSGAEAGIADAPALRIPPVAAEAIISDPSWRKAVIPSLSRPGDSGTMMVLVIWMIGTSAVLAGLLVGIGSVWRLGRRARPLTTEPWTALVERLSSVLDLHRPVTLLESDEFALPMTWGVVRPVILLPSSAKTWPTSHRETVLLHELAHVKRLDYLTQLAAEVACALHWFNPLVWLAARQLRIEREHACDDQVLCAGSSAPDYADQLLDVARSLRAARTTSLAAVAMARRSQLAGRLMAVLDENRQRDTVSRRLTFIACFSAAALILPLAAMSPMLRGSDAEGDRGGMVLAQEYASAGGSDTVIPETSHFHSSVGEEKRVALNPGQPNRSGLPPEGIAGVTEIEDAQAIETVARDLARSGESAQPAARRLRRLFHLPGAGLYLQFNRSRGPYNIVLEPWDSSKVALPMGRAILSSGRHSAAPEGSFVAVFWVNDDQQQAYTLRIPPYLTHVTIVANGREVVLARPVEHGGGPITVGVE